MTGPLHINNNVIDGVGAISFLGTGTPKAYSISMVGTEFNFNSYSDEAYATIKAGGYIFNDGLSLSYAPAGILYLNSDNPNTVIKRVGSPVDDTDAANKAYVDTVGENLAGEIAEVGEQFGNYLPLSGGTMGGALDMNFENVENMRRMGFGEVSNSRYYALFEDETLKLIDQDIPYPGASNPQGSKHFNLDCEAITTWRGYLNMGVRIWTSNMSTSSKPVLDIEGITDRAKVRITNIATPINDDDVATKGYVDAADEGFLYVDGGRLYAHGDVRKDVLLDRLNFATGGVESGGIVSLDCGAGSAGPILSVSAGDSGLALLQAKTSDFSSNDDVMTLGAVCKLGLGEYSYDQPRITTFKVTSVGIITGTYMLRAPEGVWLINVSGSQEDSFTHAESRLIGSTADITVTLNDALTMTITFSLATHAVSISKVIGIAPLTLEGVS